MIIRADRLVLEVGDGASRRRLIDEVSFKLSARTTTLVTGESGAGKSTLLSIVACLRRPSAGQLIADGEPVSRFVAEHRDKWRQQVGYIHQRLHLFEELSAMENVLIPALPLPGGVGAFEGVARDLLHSLDLPAASKTPVARMSGGERQRVAVARALLTRPKLLVLDEPTAHQDDDRCSRVLGAIDRARSLGATVLVAAHDARVRAWPGVQALLSLVAGRLADEGSCAQQHDRRLQGQERDAEA